MYNVTNRIYTSLRKAIK